MSAGGSHCATLPIGLPLADAFNHHLLSKRRENRRATSPSMTTVNAAAGAILVAFGLFLIGLTGVIFAKPAVAERFFMSFASSARSHYTEQVVRLLIGASLIIRSGSMWQPKVFWFVGWAIVLSSTVLILAPWQWHRRFGEEVRPMLIRHMKLFAAGLLAFGVFLIYGVLAAIFR